MGGRNRKTTNLHAAVCDLPLEFFAILSGEIPNTIGSTKGVGGGSQTMGVHKGAI